MILAQSRATRKISYLLYILAEAFAKFAAALEEYSKRPQPLLAGKAKEVVNWAGTQLQAWWEANAVEGRDSLVRLPVIGASLAVFGLAGADMHFATPLVGALVGGPKAIAAIKAAMPTGGLGKKASEAATTLDGMPPAEMATRYGAERRCPIGTSGWSAPNAAAAKSISA